MQRAVFAVLCVALAAGVAAAGYQQFEMPGVQSKAGIKFKCDKARGLFWAEASSDRYGCRKPCAPSQACTVTCEPNGRCMVQLPAATPAVDNDPIVQQFVRGFAIAPPR